MAKSVREPKGENAIVANDDNENDEEYLIDRVSERLSDTKPNFYVPPYLLSFSDDFLRFEDCTADGSITIESVKEGALRICEKLIKAGIDGDSAINMPVPDTVTAFCQEVHPSADLGKLLHQNDSVMKVPYLLSTFGWEPCVDESTAGKWGVIVKCKICQAKAFLSVSLSKDEEQIPKKRQRVSHNVATLKLLESHRIYCPCVGGFSFGPGLKPDLPGWKVVVLNLLKSVT